MKKGSLFVILALSVLVVATINAQVTRQTGVIKGVITEENGNGIPGMQVSGRSTALIGVISTVTDIKGAFRLVNLPPGTYTITAELAGFKTVKQADIAVEVGRTYTVNLATQVGTINEEITVVGAAPVVDVQSNKVGSVVTTELLQNLPLGRNMLGIFKTVAGANGTIDTYAGSIHGGASTTVTYEIDGVNNNDPTHNGMLVKPQYDSVEEIEISTGGLPAQIGNTGGSFANIVTKSGGNVFHGQFQAYYTKESLTQNLYPTVDLKAMGMGIPVLPKYDLDTSFSLGGPIIKDKLWFYGTINRTGTEYYTSFRPIAINGKNYSQYSDPKTEWPFFFKLTAQISKNLRFFAMINGSVLNRDVYNGGGSRLAYDATFTLKNNTWVAATGELNWTLGADTFATFRGGYTNRWYPITARSAYRNNIGYNDLYTNYQYNGITSNESYITRRTVQGSGRLTRFLDNVLGGNHELGAGVELSYNFDRYGYGRGNPLTQYLYNGDPYMTRGKMYIGHTDPVAGDGQIDIAAMAPAAGGQGTTKDLPDLRISGYLQDSFTIQNRLTFNVGLRIDHYNGYFGGGTSTGVTDSLALAIGDQLKANGAGYNPFAAFSFGKITNLVNFTTLSPRVGVSYDLFGDGKTAIKASFSRYYESMPVMFFSWAQPGFGAIYGLYWFDTNGNKLLDPTDKYTPRNGYGQFNPPDYAALRAKVDSNLKTPDYTEWTASVSREVAKNFFVKIEYIHKRGYNQYGWGGLYDLAVGRYWYNPNNAPAGYWVPYTTTIPGVGDYKAQTVTVYLMTNNGPVTLQDSKTFNNPDSIRKYDGLELSFEKRYSSGWALGGSVVYSKLKSANPLHPNDFQFLDELDANDVPLAIKLYGSVRLPLDFIGSFFYQHLEGMPYARSVWINVPQSFIDANNLWETGTWTQVEPIGAHRYSSYDNVDLRVEKEFKFSFGVVSVFADIFNALGNKYVDIGVDPGGVWTPETGQLTDLNWDYGMVTGVRGVRTYKFSVRFTF